MTMRDDETKRSDETMRNDETMDSEELRHEVADLHRGRPHATEEQAEALAQRLAGEDVPYAESSPRDRGPEQARRAIDEDSGQGGADTGQGQQDTSQGQQNPSQGQQDTSQGQPSEVSSFRTSPLGDNESVGTDEVMPPADLAQQRAQGPGHDYRVGATNETAAEDVEVMPRSKYRADGDDREERRAAREERTAEREQRIEERTAEREQRIEERTAEREQRIEERGGSTAAPDDPDKRR